MGHALNRLDRLWNEAAEWCSAGPASFRDLSIAPSEALRDDPIAFLAEHGEDGLADEVAFVVERRRLQLPTVARSVEGSRILLSAVTLTVADGASHDESAGWIDAGDLPPWGAWMAYVRFRDEWLLVSHVPVDWLERVERAVRVNPVDCMCFATLDDLHAIELLLPEPDERERSPFR